MVFFGFMFIQKNHTQFYFQENFILKLDHFIELKRYIKN